MAVCEFHILEDRKKHRKFAQGFPEKLSYVRRWKFSIVKIQIQLGFTRNRKRLTIHVACYRKRNPGLRFQDSEESCLRYFLSSVWFMLFVQMPHVQADGEIDNERNCREDEIADDETLESNEPDN